MYQYIVQIIYTRNVCRNLSQIIVFYHEIVTLAGSQQIKNHSTSSRVILFYARQCEFTHKLPGIKQNLTSVLIFDLLGTRPTLQEIGAKRRNPGSPDPTPLPQYEYSSTSVKAMR